MSNDSIKIVIVGDGAVGKTCLLLSYIEKRFPGTYQPTVFEQYSGSINVNGKTLELKIWDTAGQSDHERLRRMMYSGVDVIILCFSVVHEISYENVRCRWIEEVLKYVPNVPIILVGTKTDLRSQIQPGYVRIITYDQGSRLAKRINAASYVECSALNNFNVKTVFDKAISVALEKRKTSPSRSAGDSKKEHKKRSKSKHIARSLITDQLEDCEIQ